MSYTSDQIAALKLAISTGALTARNANGETVTYRSLADMQRTLALMEAEVTPPTDGAVRFINPTFSNGC